MFSQQQFEILKKATAHKAPVGRVRGSEPVSGGTPRKRENAAPTVRSRPKEKRSGFDPREVARSGPQFQACNGAYSMTPFVQEPREGGGEYSGPRRERQVCVLNRKYSRFSRS